MDAEAGKRSNQMLHFVTSLPGTLEPNAIYYVQRTPDIAEHYVADQAGNPIRVSTEQLVQSYMETLKGATNGYAELDGDGTVPVSQLPAGASPADINTAISALDTSLQAAIALKANSADVYTTSQIDSIESGLQSQIDGKQASLTNAAEVVKIGNSTFDGDPMVLLKTSQW